MKKQKKSSVNNNNIMNKKLQNGITLIALVISIIVMLILAGVSINAVVGENGVLTKAQNASIESKKAGILEAIDLELASYNIDTILSKPEITSTMLSDLMSKGLIDTVLSSTGQVTDTSKALAIPQFDDKNNYTGYTDYGVKKEDYSIILSVDTTGIYKAKYGEVKVSSGGSVAAGTTVVTGNAFNSGSGTENPEEKGKFTIDNDASVMFVDEIKGELSIQVKAGKHAKVNIFKNMTLTNAGVKRSAIDIEPGGTLDLYVAEGATVTVNSGLGGQGETATGLGAKGGPGGYAGIHVPEGAILNLKGTGTLKAIGGNAGDGGGSGPTPNNGGGGGGGAGAGIGGNGGAGGDANTEYWGASKPNHPITTSGEDGEKGENCGSINIYNSLIVYAYGGAGGGSEKSVNISSPCGGGGYPAAGIGGGGAGGGGGDHADGGGGYTGGGAESLCDATENGEGGVGSNWCGGSGYFSAGSKTKDMSKINTCVGGQGGNAYSTSEHKGDTGGDGGVAGNGGNIKVSSTAKIHAFNGNKWTDDLEEHKYQDGVNQLEIFAQNGVLRAVYKYNAHWGEKKYNNYTYLYSIIGSNIAINKDVEKPIDVADFTNILIRAESTCSKLSYINPTTNNCYGVGSGAGYIEVSNGTYEMKSDMN